ncbi:MAG: hypothetical protein ACLFO2_02650 [Candidatus Woesearchaeota archaeon]
MESRRFLDVTAALLILLLIPHFSSALGVIPSSHQAGYEPGEEYTYRLKVVNNAEEAARVTLEAEGDLEPYLSLSQEELSFRQGETEKFVDVTLSQPSSSAKRGEVTGRVIVREQSPGQGQIGATVTVASKLTLLIPYDGAYIESKLYIGKFAPGQRGNFVVEAENKGDEDVTDAQVFLKVRRAATGEEVASLSSDTRRVAAGGVKHFSIPWQADVTPGNYRVTATTVYADESFDEEKEFRVGEAAVMVDDITVKDFSLGGIAKFDILLRNEWGNPLEDVYATVQVRDDDSSYASSTTQSVDLEPLQAKRVSAYWDTENVAPGGYEMDVTTFYKDKTTEKTIPITIRQDDIETGATGQVTASEDGEDAAIYLLVVLVLVVLVTNILLFRKLKGKK